MKFILPVSILVSFLIAVYMTPWSIRYLRRIGLIVKDQNKYGKPLIPISGGMAVLAGFFIGMMVYLFFEFINSRFNFRSRHNTKLRSMNYKLRQS